ncbi:MAG: ParB/RepB/Spo0J family partition protein [Desulfohalobiaceae bacterium]|nr:ParB/RepB/Spo0J family partition protein [Desulfohalobiaceae bacterium]
MSTVNRGLGRGLDALFSSANEQAPPEGNAAENIPIDRIEPNPSQPRKRISEQSLRELSDSISHQGVLQPILLRPNPGETGKFQIVAGERRWRASCLAGLETVPAIVKEMTDSDALIVGLVENLQREDLNPMEESEAIEHLQVELKISQEALAQKIGKSRPAIANSLRLLQLDPATKEAVRNDSLSAGAARTLLGISDPDMRQRFFEYVVRNKTSVRQIEAGVGHWKKHGRLPAHIWKEQSASGRAESGTLFEGIKKACATRIRERVNCPVKISGDTEKGRITLSYRSENELQNILEHFGVAQAIVSRETTQHEG